MTGRLYGRMAIDGSFPSGTVPLWLPVVAGLAALYGPVYKDLAVGLWQADGETHAPLIALVSAFIIGHRWRAFTILPDTCERLGGSSVFGFGLATAVVGIVTNNPLLSMASQPLVLAGAALLLRGWPGLRMLAFPLAYMIFMIPLPGVLEDALTGQFAIWISAWTEELLYFAGYPIARSGVIIAIGQYQLLIAEACSGVDSMLSMTAVGVLFIWLVQPRARWHSAMLLVSLLPIALGANLARVLLLMLITYHFGLATGSAWHDWLGWSVFAGELGVLLAIDAVGERMSR